jgi:hypothetical protein
MARYLLVLRPPGPVEAGELITGLEPLIQRLRAEVDHRTTAHLSAVLGSGDPLRMQLFADVQTKADGKVLELVLMSREAMGRGAPQTRQWFERLADAATETMPDLQLVFRSDRDGPLPDRTAT